MHLFLCQYSSFCLFLCHDSCLPAGSYVALTVLGRPPGLPHIPLEEDKEEGGEVSLPSSLSVPHSPALPGGEQRSSTSCSPQEHIASPLPDGVRKRKSHVWSYVFNKGTEVTLTGRGIVQINTKHPVFKNSSLSIYDRLCVRNKQSTSFFVGKINLNFLKPKKT